MDKRNIFRYLLLPTLVGLLVTAVVYVYALPSAGEVISPEEMVDVVVVRQPIAAKTVITADMVAREQLPVKYVHRFAVRDVEQAIGLVSLVPLAEGEVVLSTRLAGEQTKAGLAYHVPAGMRAVSFPVNEVTAVGGFVQPGDKVDVVVSLQRQEREGVVDEGQSLLVLQNLQVLAVGPQLEVTAGDGTAAPADYTHVTVATTPEEAVTLTMVDEFARIRLLLRPAADEGERVPSHHATMQAIGR